MKILFLSQIVPYPPHGGVLQRGYNIIREISKNNEVYLLAFIHPDTQSSKEIVEQARAEMERHCKQVDFFTLWPKKSRMHTLMAFLLSTCYPLPFSTLAHKSGAFKERMKNIIDSESIDIVHFDTIGLAPYMRYSSGLPTVMTHHNIESMLMLRRSIAEKSLLSKFYLKIQARRLKKYESKQSPKFNINVVMSEIDQVELKRLAPDTDTVVVPNGVDIEYFTMRDDEQEPAVIYTGGMNMFANRDAVMYFIEHMWPLIRERRSDATFYIIGQSPSEDLLRLAETDKSLRVMGYVDDIRPIVSRSSVYIVPLRVGGGTRLKVLDSLAQGKAVVSTSIGCEGIAVEDGLNIEIEDDDRDFAARVVELINDRGRRKSLGSQARSLIETHYSWESVSVNLLAAYERLKSSRDEKQV